ncbi:MAG: hypothetical protein H6818_18835 [Phycisphaerales bacterium]|nr:hypothetical protein [Phycisphaerales bacterium]MCB9863804.1 hypothetical protein [Phycisphaerales bacterium]
MFRGSISDLVFLTLLAGVASNAVCVSGCGINPNLTDAQQDRDIAAKMAWVDKAINVAERHNLAYRVEVDATGKPSIGETVDLYFDSGVSAKLMMFGNAAAAPTTPTEVVEEPPATSEADSPTNDGADSQAETSGDSTEGAK